MIIDTQQAISSGLGIGIQIQSLTQQQQGRCTRVPRSLHTFNLNRTQETGLRRRADPTPATRRTSVAVSATPWNQQARGSGACPSELYGTAQVEAWFPEKQNTFFPNHQDILWICKLCVVTRRKKKKSLKSTIHREDRRGQGTDSVLSLPWGRGRGVTFSSWQKPWALGKHGQLLLHTAKSICVDPGCGGNDLLWGGDAVVDKQGDSGR